MALFDRVRQFVREHDLARPETQVVVALSGGSDSVALAHLLRALDEWGALRVVGLAHFNHQLRPEAVADEAFCAALAQSIARPFLADREDVAARARTERRSIEDAARTARHAFLERARAHFEADVVALGHTRDDQAETFLLRLLRGAGARGLAGMHPRRGHLIRPLLSCRRLELSEYLTTEGVEHVHDLSNDDVRIPRNRVRAELLPLLEQRFNPAIVDVLAGEAEIAREEWRWLQAAADELGDELCRQDGDRWTFDAGRLNAAPVALARLVVRRAMEQAAGGRPVSFEHVDALLRLSREGGVRFDAPGHVVERVGPAVVLRNRPTRTAGRPLENLFHYSLSIPGEVHVVEAGCVVSAEASTGGAAVSTLTAVTVRLDRCAGPLAVRNRRPGDRFRPLGLAGRKKLQDFFVDRKVAREARDAVPLVVDQADRIVWVAGYAIDEDFRVTDPSQTVLVLRLKLPGGSA